MPKACLKGVDGQSAERVLPLKAGEISSLREALSEVPDPRKSNRVWRLSSLPVLICMGLLAGRKNLAEIHRYGQFLTQQQRRWLGFRRERKSGLLSSPSYSALYNLTGKLDPDKLAQTLVVIEKTGLGDSSEFTASFYLSNLQPAPAAPFARLVRGHRGGCEIRNHWVRDAGGAVETVHETGREGGRPGRPFPAPGFFPVMSGIADTGFIVAFLNRRDLFHSWAVKLAEQVDKPLVTCEAVLAEAIFHTRSAEKVLALLRMKLLRVDMDFSACHSRLEVFRQTICRPLARSGGLMPHLPERMLPHPACDHRGRKF